VGVVLPPDVARLPEMAGSIAPGDPPAAREPRQATRRPTTRAGAGIVHTVSDLTATIQERLDSMTLALLARVAELTRRSSMVSQRASVLVVWLTAGILAIACGAGVLIGRRISRPLRDLLLGIRRVMEGHWGHRVATSGRGELAELGQAFNTMVAELERSRAGLEVNHPGGAGLPARRKSTRRTRRRAGRAAGPWPLASVAHELNNRSPGPHEHEPAHGGGRARPASIRIPADRCRRRPLQAHHRGSARCPTGRSQTITAR
jgi:HAMP domain-containing protein